MSELFNRKRASSEQEENTTRKVPRNVATVCLKILIPSNLAGVVLGKGGETIIRIQEEANIKAHMSKGTEFFPGTNDRVCSLSSAEAENIREGLSMICEKLFEKMVSLPEKLTLKILIPNETAGMIIGKGGEHIRGIKEKTGAFVQLSRLSNLPERIITISGSKSEISSAADELVEMISKDPLSSGCFQINYNDSFGSSLNTTNSIRPSILGENLSPLAVSNILRDYSRLMTDFSNGDDSDSRSNDLSFSFNFTCPKTSVGSWMSPDLMDYLSTLLKGGGYRNQAVNEIINAIEILIKYGVLNSSSKRSLFNSGGFSFENMGNSFPPRFPRAKDNGDAFVLPSHYGEDEQGEYLALQVSDTKVGSIMGARGSTLTEIQQLSKARIRVSKKDEYVGGTKDRLVFIYGGKKEVDLARQMVEYKVKEFDLKNSKR